MGDCCCDDCCNCTCCSNCCLKSLMALIMTVPILINTLVFCFLALISNIIFGFYYSIAGWTCETSCCCNCCYCKDCFADSIKGPWKPLRYFCSKIIEIFKNPLVEEKDVF